MKTTKSPVMMAIVAFEAGKKSLPLWRHEKSPKKFTQPQLFTCLVLKSFFKTDYRGIVSIIEEHVVLRKILCLEQAVPHYTTLQKASRRLLNSKTAKRLLSAVRRMDQPNKQKNTSVALFDSTGFDTEHASSVHTSNGGKTAGQKTNHPCGTRNTPNSQSQPFPERCLLLRAL